MKTLSLVVPVYNAPDLVRTLRVRVPELSAAADSSGFRLVEVILVDDASTPPLEGTVPLDSPLEGTVPLDSTGTVPKVRGTGPLGSMGTDPEERGTVPGVPVPGVPVVVLRNEVNRGKGFSVRRGALAARGDWVLMSDVDLSAPLTEFVRLAPHADSWMVCGSRYGRPGMPLRRRVLSRLFHAFVRLTGVRGVHDTQCGFKLFQMKEMRRIFEIQRIERFAFDVELICLVQRAGGTVAEVPVEWHGGPRSSLNVLRDAPRMLYDLFRIR